MDLTKQKNIFALNLSTGDVFTEQQSWKEYYDTSDPEPGRGQNKHKIQKNSRAFKAGSVVGCLVDMDLGTINFFKDGQNLGRAVKSETLKHGMLFPFV